MVGGVNRGDQHGVVVGWRMISNFEIDEVVVLAGRCFDHAGIRGKAKREYFLSILGSGLRNRQKGIVGACCHRCLGTGYEPTEDEA